MVRKRPLVVLTIIFVVISLLVVACGQTSTEAPEATPATGGEQEVTEVVQTPALPGATPEAQESGEVAESELRVAHQGPMRSFLTIRDLQSWQFTVDQNIFNGLLRYDTDWNVVGDLAESWDVADEGRQWTFHLKDGIRWHDGEPFTSEDVVFHYELLLTSEVPEAYSAPKLRDANLVITAPDDHTVQMVFDSPQTAFTFLPPVSDQLILPKHLYDGTDVMNNPANSHPIGTGPFRFVEWVEDQYVALEANPDYFGGRPFVDKLTFVFYKDKTSALLALEAGDVDSVGAQLGIPAEEAPRLQADPKYEVEGYPYYTVWRVVFNFRDECQEKYPWVGDIRVRQAFAHAIDRQAIVDDVLNGMTTTTWGPFSNTIGWVWNDEIADSEPDYDPALAEELLDEAGFPRGGDGVRFSAPLYVYQYVDGPRVAEVVKEMLRQVGIDVTLNVVDRSTFLSEYYRGEGGMKDIPLALFTGATGPDPEFAIRLYHGELVPPDAGQNMGFYNNPEVNDWLDVTRSTGDQDIRADAFQKAAELMIQDLPSVWLFNNYQVEVWDVESFTGFSESTRPLPWYGDYTKVRPVVE